MSRTSCSWTAQLGPEEEATASLEFLSRLHREARRPGASHALGLYSSASGALTEVASAAHGPPGRAIPNPQPEVISGAGVPALI